MKYDEYLKKYSWSKHVKQINEFLMAMRNMWWHFRFLFGQTVFLNCLTECQTSCLGFLICLLSGTFLFFFRPNAIIFCMYNIHLYVLGHGGVLHIRMWPFYTCTLTARSNNQFFIHSTTFFVLRPYTPSYFVCTYKCIIGMKKFHIRMRSVWPWPFTTSMTRSDNWFFIVWLSYNVHDWVYTTVYHLTSMWINVLCLSYSFIWAEPF